VTSKIMTMSRMRPTPPLGHGPHDALCGHVGRAPTSRRIKITIKIVPSDISGSFHFVPWPAVAVATCPEDGVAPGH
jgi:hypothetical protein